MLWAATLVWMLGETGVALAGAPGIYASMENTEIRLNPPAIRERVFDFDAPWEGFTSAYVSLITTPEGHRMYYRGSGATEREYTCVALSEDGITWTRPSLEITPFKGRTDTNIIWTAEGRKAYGESHNFAPFLDANPAATADARYKAVALGHADDARALMAMASQDGFHWRRLHEEAVMTEGSFDSLNTAFWDTRLGCYVCYLRVGIDGIRGIARSTSPDFLTWDTPKPLIFTPPHRWQLYTNGVTFYPGAPDIYIGLPMRFVPERKSIGSPARTTNGLSDGLFMFSRDGLDWTLFGEAWLRPGPTPSAWGDAHNNQTCAAGVIPTAPGVLSVYWIETDEQGVHLRRGEARAEGFTSLHAGNDEASCLTKPFNLTGASLALNYATSAVGQVTVEVTDAQGAPLPGLAMEGCEPLYGDELGREVHWRDGASLGEHTGSMVCLRFEMRDADIFAWRIR